MQTKLAAAIGFADSIIHVTDPLDVEIVASGEVYARIEEEYLQIVAGTGSTGWIVARGALNTARTGHAIDTAVEVVDPALIDRGDLEPAAFAPAGAAAVTFEEVDANGAKAGAVVVPANAVIRSITAGQITTYDAASADLAVDVDGTDLGSATDLTAVGGTDVDIALDDAAAAGLLDAAAARTVTATVTIGGHAGTDGRARVVVAWDNPASSTAAS